MTAATVTVPHAGEGTHTLVVAIEVDDLELARTDLIDDVLEQVRGLTEPLLTERRDQALHGLVEHVLELHQVDLEAIRAKTRDVDAVRARRHLCAELRRAGWSFPQIGRFVQRDHSTVMHAIAQHEQAQRGEQGNRWCEDCGQDALGGGRWCLPCFQKHARRRRDTPRKDTA